MKTLVIQMLSLIFIFPLCTFAQEWIHAKHVGGPLYDAACAINTDNEANVYVGGDFNYIGFFGSDTLYSNGYRDYFLSKFNSSGNLQWTKNGGGDGISMQSVDYISDILIRDTNIFVIGSFNGITSFGNLNLSCDGIGNAFIAKMSTNGDFIWAKKIGGSDFDEADIIISDNNGCIYVAGISTSPILQAQNLSLNMNNHMFFITKLDYDGNFKWLKSIDGNGWFQISDMEYVDNSIYLTGGFNGNINLGPVSFITDKAFLPCIAKLDTSANGVWGYSLNCENNGYISSICHTANDFLYCCGVSDGTLIVSTDTVRNSGYAFQADLSGNINWLKPMGYEPKCITCANNNEIVISGILHGTHDFSDCQMTSTSNYTSMSIAKVNAFGECLETTQVGNVNYIGNCRMGSDNNLYFSGSCYATTFGNIPVGNYGNADAFWAKLDYVSGFGENKPGDNVLFIYANPNTGVFNVEVPDEVMNERQVSLKIFDNNNRLVKQQTLDLAEETLHLQVEDSAPGIYYLQLISKHRVYQGKMVVQ